MKLKKGLVAEQDPFTRTLYENEKRLFIKYLGNIPENSLEKESML